LQHRVDDNSDAILDGRRILSEPLRNILLHSIDVIFHRSYNGYMAWEVEYTDAFEAWWNGLTEEEQIELDAKVRLLEQHGPVLPRPHSDVIVTSRHANMKELRGKVIRRQQRAELRVLYAFDPRRTAILLIGGNKTGDPSWYEQYVPIADQLFDDHLKKIEQEEKKHGKEFP
jgi:hypothetical protein